MWIHRIKLGIGVIDVKVNHIETPEEIARAIEARRKCRRPRTRRLDPSGLRLLDAQAFRGRSQDRARLAAGRDLYLGIDMIRQITDGPHINHPTYFLQSSFFPGDRRDVLHQLPHRRRARLFEDLSGDRRNRAS